MNFHKLTCGPEPAPICTIVNGQRQCIAAPLRCIGICDAPGDCVTVCCASFAPEPVPALGWAPLGLTAALVVLVAWILKRGRNV